MEIFDINLALSLEAYYKTHLATRVLGWQKDVFLMTHAIYVNGQPAKLTNGDHCKIRFLKDGIAYGFESEIISILFFPFPLMFLKYPTTVETLQLRVSPRCKVDLPATFTDAAGNVIASDAVLLDLSEGGCGLKVPMRQGLALSPDSAYKIMFQIIDKELTISLGLRKIDKKGDYAFFLGMEFLDMPPQDKETLALILEFLRKHRGT